MFESAGSSLQDDVLDLLEGELLDSLSRERLITRGESGFSVGCLACILALQRS